MNKYINKFTIKYTDNKEMGSYKRSSPSLFLIILFFCSGFIRISYICSNRLNWPGYWRRLLQKDSSSARAWPSVQHILPQWIPQRRYLWFYVPLPKLTENDRSRYWFQNRVYNPRHLCQNGYHSGVCNRLWCQRKRDLWHNSCVIAEFLKQFCPLRNRRSGRFFVCLL